MVKISTLRKLATSAILFLLITAKAFADDIVTIKSDFYHIDQKNKLIIINQSTDELNAGNKNIKAIVLADKEYTFSQPSLTVTTKTAYKVKTTEADYTLYFTQLPIIHIDTRKAIVDTPSVYAQFRMTELNGTTTRASIGIEFRGAFSQTLPKKSYELSFWGDSTGATSQDVRLLAMRTDNKWNLQAMYNEPLRLNSKVANELWLDMHQPYYKTQEPDAKSGIAEEYAELFINDEYRGLYLLTERVDRKQLKLKKYSNGIKGELYKGGSLTTTTALAETAAYNNASAYWAGFEYKEPQEKVDWSNLYNFVKFVQTSSKTDFDSQYQSKFRLDNAVDYYIFLNLTRAWDNTGKNVYIAKYKANEPYFYVPWDLDGVFGNTWYGGQDSTTNDLLTNGLYDRLMKDCSAGGFRETLVNRWAALRTTLVTEEKILARIREKNSLLLSDKLYEREHIAWPDYAYDQTQLAFVAAWVKARLAYLDATLSLPCTAPKTSTTLAAATANTDELLKLYPNPASDAVVVETAASAYEVCLQDLNGRVVLTAALTGRSNKLPVSNLPRGLYIATIKTDKLVKVSKLLLN